LGGAIANYIGVLQNTYFVNTNIRDNLAWGNGGGILFTANSPFAPPELNLAQETTSQKNTRTFPERYFQFENCSITNNTAVYGGAIYIDTTQYEIPAFSPGTIIFGNLALEFGGGLFINEFIPTQAFMHRATFENDALYAGANVAFGEIAGDSSEAGSFCGNCTFLMANQSTQASYQDSNGFATPPSYLNFISSKNTCPTSENLNAQGSDIQVFLFDTLGTLVTGNYLHVHQVQIKLSTSGTAQVTTENNTLTAVVNAETGGALFPQVELQGHNNSTSRLLFTPLDRDISPVYCSISLFGCPEGYSVKSGETFDTCEAQVHVGLIVLLSLLVGSMIMVLVLCVLLSLVLIRKIQKIRKQAKLMELEIPDFLETPAPTLIEILSDPAIKRIPWEEITVGTAIGRGASGLVSKGVWTKKAKNSKARDIALKELICGLSEFSPEVLVEFLKEIKLMSALEHKNVVSFLGVCCPNPSKLYLVTELMHNGSVSTLIEKKKGNLSWAMRLKFAKHAAKGVAYLHAKKLIHRDLKTDNLLVNNEWKCKVADFGISTVKPAITRTMTCIGTPVYMAPEVLSKNKYSEKADVYSFGIVLAELATGIRPYSDGEASRMNQAQLMFNIVNNALRPTIEGIPLGLQQLIVDCWNIDPPLRPSFAEIVIRLKRLSKLPELQDGATCGLRGEISDSLFYDTPDTGETDTLLSDYQS